jgi:hypothetical protein
MSDLPRLRDSGDDAVASLLDAARAYRRPPAAKSRLLQALGLPVAFTVVPASAAVASSLGAKVLLLVSAAAVVGGGGAVAYQVHVRSRTAAGLAAPHPARAHRASPPQPAPVEEVGPALSPAPLGVVPETPERRPAAPRRQAHHAAPAREARPADVPSPVAPAPQRAPLAREIALLDAAERAFRGQDYGEVIARLDEYVRAFPDGALLAEAEVLRISALFDRGDLAGARRRAQSFLAHYPPSPLTARVTSLLSRHPPQPSTKELP